jgi:hypothetical protein
MAKSETDDGHAVRGERRHIKRDYSAELRGMSTRLYDKTMEIADEMPIYYISDAHVREMNDMAPDDRGTIWGYYDQQVHAIFMNASVPTPYETVFPEAFHAATARAIDSNSRLKGLAKRLGEEVWNHPDFMKYVPNDRKIRAVLQYAFHDAIANSMRADDFLWLADQSYQRKRPEPARERG